MTRPADENADPAALDAVEQRPSLPPKQGIRLSPLGWTAAGVVAFWLVMAVIGPWIAPWHEADFIEFDAKGEYVLNPSFMLPDKAIHVYLGTDYLGRDVLSRIVWGARTTIGISLAATFLAYGLGVTLGITAAVSGRALDMGSSRFFDAVLAFPNIMLALILIAVFQSSIPLLILLGGFIYAAPVFRISRALGQDIMVQDYVEAAKARGEGLWWILTREILPNAIMPLATDFGLRLVYVILFVSSLSFLGLGVQPPAADWGSMVRENMRALSSGLDGGALACVAPAFAIASLAISINLIVDDISAASGGRLAGRMS